MAYVQTTLFGDEPTAASADEWMTEHRKRIDARKRRVEREFNDRNKFRFVNFSTRKIGGLRWVKLGRFTIAFCVSKHYRAL